MSRCAIESRSVTIQSHEVDRIRIESNSETINLKQMINWNLIYASPEYGSRYGQTGAGSKSISVWI